MKIGIPEKLPRLSKLERCPDTWLFQWVNDLVFHYTSVESAFNILDQNYMRFGHLTNTNDPYEQELWGIMVIKKDGEGFRADDELSIVTQIRKACRLLCLSHDSYNQEFDQVLCGVGRGWAIPSLWAHYAERHQGVCLAFGRSQLLKSTYKKAQEQDTIIASDVVYGNPPQIEEDYLYMVLEENKVQDNSSHIHQAVMEHMRSNANDIFFHKDVSWVSEREFRILVISDPAQEFGIQIDSSLVGLVTGSRFVGSCPELIRECKNLGPIELARLEWDQGRPTLEPW